MHAKKVLCLLLAAAILLSLPGCSGSPGNRPSRKEKEEPPAELELSISQDLFLAGKQVVLEFLVTCQAEVTQDVTVTDGENNVLATLKNDGSGFLKAQVPFRPAQIGEGTFTARAGKTESQPVPYSVQPEVTQEMVSTLLDVCNDLGDFLKTSAFEDPYGKNALKKITAYLEKHPSVGNVEENNGILLYQTTDGLMGSYDMGRTEEGCLGFSQTEDIYQDWTDGRDVSTLYIESPIAPTSGKCLILAPDYADTIIHYSTNIVSTLLDGVYETTDCFTGSAAREKIGTGDFTDCSFLYCVAHGSVIKRSDKSDLMFFTAYTLDDEGSMRRILEATPGGSQMLWNESPSKAETAKTVINTSYHQDGTVSYKLCVSTNYLALALRGKTFDNTVVYLAICSAYRDPYLLDLLFDHGASMVIGCPETMDIFYCFMTIQELRDIFSADPRGPSLVKYREGVDNVTISSIPKLMKALGYKEEEILTASRSYGHDFVGNAFLDVSNGLNASTFYNECRYGYTLALEEHRDISYAFRTPEHRDRVAYGEGTVTGRVLTSDGDPAAGATVTLYRWLDHSFREYEHQVQTDSQGQYRFERVPYGVYAAEAAFYGTGGSAAMTVDQPETIPEDILVDGNVILWGDAQWHPRDVNSIRNNYDSYIVAPVLLESPSRALTDALRREREQALETMDTQLQMIAKTPSGDHENYSFAYLTIEDAYCAGDVLSVKMGGITYLHGNMRPLHIDGSYSLNIATGEYVSFPEILSGSGRYPKLHSAWLQLLEEYGESALYESPGDLADQAMAGKAGSWAFTQEGLWLGFGLYDVAAYASGAKSTLIPYDQLQGELDERYLPRSGSGEKMSVRAIAPGDQRLKTEKYTIWGTETGQGLAFDGTARNIYVYACSAETEEENESILFYARSLTDAIVWLGECESGLYRVCWTTGDTHHTTMVEQ